MLLYLLVCFLAMATLLLIMRISTLNDKIAHIETQMNEMVTEEYLAHFVKMKDEGASWAEMNAQINKRKT